MNLRQRSLSETLVRAIPLKVSNERVVCNSLKDPDAC